MTAVRPSDGSGTATPLPDDASFDSSVDGALRVGRLHHADPVAVLLLDVDEGTVVHASPGAEQLTGPLALPVGAPAWSAAAHLRAPTGEPFGAGTDPVAFTADGGTVPGRPVCALREGAEPRPLWVTSLPLPAVGASSLALLVLFDVVAPASDEGAAVRDRAIVAAGLSFTLSDPHQPDAPLVFVNPAFERTTGYSAAEALGRNCRFLQGPGTDPADVERVRALLRAQEHGVVTLLNHRKDGSAFWNELSLSPVHDGNGRLTHFVGIQADVTLRVEAEQERERSLRAEQAARQAAQDNEGRLQLLADATSRLAGTLDLDEALALLTDLVVPAEGDWCMVELAPSPDGDGDGADARRFVSRHADPAQEVHLRRVEELAAAQRTEASPVAQVMRTGEPLLFEQVPQGLLDELSTGDELSEAYRALAPSSAVVVPLKPHADVLGVLTLVRGNQRRPFTPADLRTLQDLGRRVALAVDNTRLYAREQAVAEQLQRSLLPDLPDLPGLEVAAEYLPSARAAQVGGDWYDLFTLPDGAVGIAVGDVMGHDIAAAAAMGQLRSILRSYAWQGSGPAQVLDAVDHLVQGLDMAQLATAVYARLDRPQDGRPGRLTLCNAGHLPPVLRLPDGTARLLTDEVSVLLGAVPDAVRTEFTVDLPAGSTLVLYTDGLVERRGLDPDEGLEALTAEVARVGGRSSREVCAALVSGLADETPDDDVALLVLRVR